MHIGSLSRRVPVAWRDLHAGDVIVVDGERLYVREVDRSVLRNLGALVRPEGGDSEDSRWLPLGTVFDYA